MYFKAMQILARFAIAASCIHCCLVICMGQNPWVCPIGDLILPLGIPWGYVSEGSLVVWIGFLLVEDASWGAGPNHCLSVPSTESPVVTKLFLVVIWPVPRHHWLIQIFRLQDTFLGCTGMHHQ